MRILDIQNLQLCHNNSDIGTNDLNLENDVSYVEMSINIYVNFSSTLFPSGGGGGLPQILDRGRFLNPNPI